MPGSIGCSSGCPRATPDAGADSISGSVAGWVRPDRPFSSGSAGPSSLSIESWTVNRRLRRLLPAAFAAAVLTLSACGSGESAADATPTPTTDAPVSEATPTPSAAPTTSSANLDAIAVEGPADGKPEINVPAPFGVDETLTNVITTGNGTTVAENGTVEVHYTGVNGRTGEVFDDSWSRGEPISFSLAQVVPGFKKGLENQQVGSRVLIAMPGKDGYDGSGGNPQAGIEIGDTLIFVVDIINTPLKAAEGAPIEPAAGLPAVEMIEGKPRVTIPANTPAPTELVVQQLIRGGGKLIEPTDAITASYQAVVWKDGKVVEDTYGKEPETGALSGLIPAWQEGLLNQPVGSRVMLISPPDKAYPNDPGARRPNPAMGETVVYIVDLLYATPAQ